MSCLRSQIARHDAAAAQSWAKAASSLRDGEVLPVVDTQHGLLFCSVPKAGCTQILALFHKLRGTSVDLADPWSSGGVHRQPLPNAQTTQADPPMGEWPRLGL